MKVVQLFFLLLISTTVLTAAPHVWVGGNGNWSDPQNWNQGILPNTSDDVIIPSGSGNVTIQAGQKALARSIHLQNNANLDIFGSLILKPTGDYGLFCEGNAKMAAGSLMEVSGDINNTLGIWIYNGTFTANNNSELLLSELENGFLVEFGVLSNRGDIQINKIRPSRPSILIENQGYLYNWKNGEIRFYNTEAQGITLTYASSRVYNYGMIRSTYNMDGFLINIGNLDAKFFNQITGKISANASTNGISINNYGKFYNRGLIDIRSGGMFQNWSGYFHNQSSGYLKMITPNGISRGLTASGLNIPSTIINDGSIEIENVGASRGGISINIFSDFVNKGLIQVSNSESNSRGISVNEGSFKNEGGTIELNADPSETALDIRQDGLFENTDCGELVIESGDLFIQGTLINDAWLYLESDMSDFDFWFGTGELMNNGLIVDLFELMDGLAEVDNQGIVFDPLGSPPVYTGSWIQNALTLGTLDPVSFISWHLSENGPQAGTYLGSSNQLNLYANAEGATSLWLNFDFDLGQCGNVWLELPVNGTVQLPPPPPPAVGSDETVLSAPSWRVSPNPAFGPLEIQNDCADCRQIEVLIQNSTGQLVGRQSFGSDARLTIQRPSGLPDGLYYLQIRSEKQLLHTERIVWH